MSLAGSAVAGRDIFMRHDRSLNFRSRMLPPFSRSIPLVCDSSVGGIVGGISRIETNRREKERARGARAPSKNENIAVALD